jgi:anti-anti-sigma regulatory factor
VVADGDFRPFTSSTKDGVLTIVIEREFDFGSLHQDWAVSILSTHSGPFTRVLIDMSQCGRVSSTFYAGLIQLHFAYNQSGNNPLTLVKPDPRMLTNLKILRLESYFKIEA